MTNEKYYYGCIYREDGRYVKVVLKNKPGNIASFIARCPADGKVQIVTLSDMPVLDTIGNMINNCYDMELRTEILGDLIKMQTGRMIPKYVEIFHDCEAEQRTGRDKDSYINWVEKTTGYSLIG